MVITGSLTGMTAGELEHVPRDLRVSLALARIRQALFPLAEKVAARWSELDLTLDCAYG